MTRRTEVAAPVRPANSVYTALAGSACIAVLIALIFVVMRWHALTDRPMFFGPF